MAVVTKDTLIGDLLEMDATTADLFITIGMFCIACPAARGETLEQACMVHGVDTDEMVQKLNEHISKKK